MSATKQEAVIALANKIVAVQVSYTCAFEFDGEQFPSRSVDQAMHEWERAFADKDYDLAEHMAKVTAYLVKREAPRFAADPKKWIARWKDLQASYISGPTRPVKSAMKRVQHVDEET